MLQEEHSRDRESKVKGPEGECTWLIQQAKKASVGKADVRVFFIFLGVSAARDINLGNSDVALLLVAEITYLGLCRKVG